MGFFVKENNCLLNPEGNGGWGNIFVKSLHVGYKEFLFAFPDVFCPVHIEPQGSF